MQNSKNKHLLLNKLKQQRCPPDWYAIYDLTCYIDDCIEKYRVFILVTINIQIFILLIKNETIVDDVKWNIIFSKWMASSLYKINKKLYDIEEYEHSLPWVGLCWRVFNNEKKRVKVEL
jgi:hypothetical protein